MNIKEFRQLIAQTTIPDWFNSIEVELNFPSVSYHSKFKGLPSLITFCYEQQKKFQKLELDRSSNLFASLEFFNSAINTIEEFVDGTKAQSSEDSLEYTWGTYKTNLSRNGNKNILLADSGEAALILTLEKDNPNEATAAYRYLTNTGGISISSFEVLNGYLLAYEFKMRDRRMAKEAISNERKSINTLKNELRKTLPEAEKNLSEHLIKTETSVKQYFDTVEEYKKNKEKLYEDWFINAKGGFETFNTESSSKIEELEETYNQKLKLEEPAKYWKDRGESLKKHGHGILAVTLILVGLCVASLWYILVSAPTEIYASFFNNDKSAAIRWSIIYITLLSFMAFAIKLLSKVMFSSYHLARDCQERYTLTYFYLSLLKNSAIEPAQQQLIMQSLFSRAESGLLKDDGSPTMPTDMAKTVLGK